MARTCMSNDRNCHQSDRASTSDEHIFAQNRKRKCSMNGVAERIENSSNFLIDATIMPPDIGHGQRDELRKRSWTVDADSKGGRAKMTSPSQAVATTSADDVPFTTHDVPRIEVVDIGSNLDNLPNEFMSYGHRHLNCLLCPVVPLIDMHVRAADSGVMHAHEHVIDADYRVGNFL